MFTKQTSTVFFGLLVVLTLVVPTVSADHLQDFEHVWNDAGLNTRSVQNSSTAQWNMPRADQYSLGTWLLQNNPVFWNDAGLNTKLNQAETTGWNDTKVTITRLENHVQGWNDVGTGVELA